MRQQLLLQVCVCVCSFVCFVVWEGGYSGYVCLDVHKLTLSRSIPFTSSLSPGLPLTQHKKQQLRQRRRKQQQQQQQQRHQKKKRRAKTLQRTQQPLMHHLTSLPQMHPRPALTVVAAVRVRRLVCRRHHRRPHRNCAASAVRWCRTYPLRHIYTICRWSSGVRDGRFILYIWFACKSKCIP